MLANMLKRSPPDRKFLPPPKADQVHEEHVLDESEDDGESRGQHGGESQVAAVDDAAEDVPETAPLLSITSHQSWQIYGTQNGRTRGHVDLEGQKRPHTHSKSWTARTVNSVRQKKAKALEMFRTVRDPKCWDRRVIWQNVAVAPVACLPAVVVGLLLNILDALSYGKWCGEACQD
jgi:sulfate permease, SulP family